MFIAAAAGALIVGPMVGTASATAITPAHQDTGSAGGPGPDQGQGGDWGGYNRPGWTDPGDPYHQDWHCDRHGNWHNDEHDQWGHRDDRCRNW